MFSLGMDIGSSTVKLVLLKDKEIEKQWMAGGASRQPFCLPEKRPFHVGTGNGYSVFTLRDRQQYGGLVRA